MDSLLDSIVLPWIALKVKLREFFWQKQVEKKYYINNSFKKIDQAFLKDYCHLNPYKISSMFMRSIGEKDVHVYGETPLQVYDQIINRWKVHKKQAFIELGCGRGRGLFFVSQVHLCPSVGIEWIPLFVKEIRDLCERLAIQHVLVIQQDFTQLEKLEGEMVYFYSLCFADELIVKMCDTFVKAADKKTKFITVSFPLSDYDKRFIVKDQFESLFPWGKGTVFLNQINS